MLKRWFKNNKRLVLSGKQVLCDECPCGIVDHIIITYHFTSADGRDLDTRTKIINPIESTTLGWCRDSSNMYMIFGGDNTGYGVESVYINAVDLFKDFPDNDFIDMSCSGMWYSSKASGNISLGFKAYNGGTITKSGTGFINTGGFLLGELFFSDNLSLQSRTCSDEELIAVIRYDKTTNDFTRI